MDTHFKNSKILNEYIDRLAAELIKSFENMLAHANMQIPAPGQQPENNTDTASVAHQSMQMELDATKLVKTTEDILSLTRQMQELWLFGKLNTLDQGKEENRMTEDVKAVAQMLGTLIKATEESKAPA